MVGVGAGAAVTVVVGAGGGRVVVVVGAGGRRRGGRGEYGCRCRSSRCRRHRRGRCPRTTHSVERSHAWLRTDVQWLVPAGQAVERVIDPHEHRVRPRRAVAPKLHRGRLASGDIVCGDLRMALGYLLASGRVGAALRLRRGRSTLSRSTDAPGPSWPRWRRHQRWNASWSSPPKLPYKVVHSMV